MIQMPMMGISLHPYEEQPCIHMFRAATLGISAHPSEEQPCIRMIQTPTSGITAHPSEEQPYIRMIQTPMSGISAHLFNASDSTSKTTSDTWIFDTACTHHMAHNHELFHDYNQFPTPITVHGIGSGEHLAYG
jgi:Pol polyprotein, beta-barrel domain